MYVRFVLPSSPVKLARSTDRFVVRAKDSDSIGDCLVLAQYGGARDRVRGKPVRGYTPRLLHPCEESSCYPATGNLLIGRENQLTASSTCGLYGQQRYCIVSHLEERKKCFWCDSRKQTANKPQVNHQISNIVYTFLPGTLQKSWWQSENGKENVTIQLDLEAEFHFTHLIIVFKTFRPAAMLIERSYDFGKTWQVYRYFAANCADSFPGVREGYLRNLTDVVCISRYSTVEPSSGGEVIFRVLPPNVQIDNPYSQEVQNLLKMTNLRINFTKLHTLGDDLLDKRQDIQEKYYYSISDMVVRGSCSCYGHANRCLPLPGFEPKPDMVHGRCECTHNTKGRNCEECEDFFNDLPWRPAIGKQTNACKKCNCNNHATSCHFDAAVYELTGRVSGGVCDGCKHNTMGPNCEQCKPFYYRDPTRDLQDPEVCRPCDCDPHGSLDGGVCDSLTDTSNSLEAGACHCKKNVEGRRCDICKNGFWNFDFNNPDGCQTCTCNTLGTIDNQGCDVYTGDCICKRYVTGRDCNQCLPEYWGLSEKRDGCQSCDCDPGGSLDNNCDVLTGQCRCRDHVQGRTCNQPKQHFFTGSLDFFVYEAESATGSPTCQVVIREPYRDGRENTWTGIGFMRAFENSHMEFTIDDIKVPMEYDIVLRYEPQLPEQWDEVIVSIERPATFNPYGVCGNYSPQNDVRTVTLPQGTRNIIALPSVCIEPDQTYKVRLDFKRYNVQTESPSASILVDSIVLIPHIDRIPFFQGTISAANQRQEFERYRCAQSFYSANKGQVPDVCKKYHNSIGFYVYNGALSCQCDPTGSTSKLCSDYGGTCQCKPNVVGRRCDRCSPGTYGFSPVGCTACDCNSIGALDNFCNVTTGQCKCRSNTYGRECDQCQPGYWNFPNCQRCECNGHADICESKTGICISCRNHTEGSNCDSCSEGYYGDPRFGVDIPCRACPCPGVAGSGHSYAHRCVLDAHSRDVICDCQEGYAGSRCDVCADNYYGNPEVPGGTCQPCNCSNNVDVTRPGNCDPHTGKCLQCLFNTEGDHCEICMANYFRLVPEDVCTECGCDFLGTNRTAGPCDRNTGQCPCLDNVVGRRCDMCRDNHWKIAIGDGCDPCDCDEFGSLAPQCNLFDGQCECKPHFGGRRCNECQANHWGDPNSECFTCDCNPDGSQSLQCARDNGTCTCIQGIGGGKCDTCARGYLGEAPHCSPCGECFDNWDRILNNRHQQTLDIIDKARKMKKVGATGEINLKQITLNDLKNKEDTVRNITNQLKNNATILQQANVLGALELIQVAKQKSMQAADEVNKAKRILDEADRQCRSSELTVNRTIKGFLETNGDINMALEKLQTTLDENNEKIPIVNNQICDKMGNPCDSLCGGADCGFCGGVSCEEGAMKKAENALYAVNTAEIYLREKELKVDELLRAATQLKDDVNNAKDLANSAYDRALLANNNSNSSLENRNEKMVAMLEFLEKKEANPTDVITLTDEINQMNIKLEPEEITDLADKIKNTLQSLTNIDVIIKDTAPNLEKANVLKKSADEAKNNANGILTSANRIVEALTDAKNAQDKAESAIDKVKDDIKVAEKALTEIASESSVARSKANETAGKVETLQKNLKNLQENVLKNKLFATEVGKSAKVVEEQAKSSEIQANMLKEEYDKVNKTLVDKSSRSHSSRGRANELLQRALKLTINTNSTLNELQDIQSAHNKHETNLKELSDTIDELNGKLKDYLDEINKRVSDLEICS
ncbi:LanB1 [Carabus blaptoides fortunei]